ncbi:putative gustatory receptor clone PTE03 [Xenopus laevis]|uniref:Gustatory receptor clone PTE03 n=1 Tax=Xenopus laevis TaxID=8355 RepID=A0A8J1M6F4_XENLA|nr:putative gustatory receptor clone PTE03 [Xenopus laevis]
MQNFTPSNPSILTLYFGEMTQAQYLYSVFTLIGFTAIVLTNGAVIILIVLHDTLHKPMYIFISLLCINSLYGCFAFFPRLFVNLISKTQTISYFGCITQVFCLHTYFGCELSLLTAMALDRYVCICNPFWYNHIMSLRTVCKMTVAAWLFAIIPVSVIVLLTIRLPLCGNIILKIYCDNWSVVRLSCIDTTINNIVGLFIMVGFLTLLPLFILYSYVEILKVCLKSSKVFQAKAWQTCAPHIISVINFMVIRLFEFLDNRLSLSNLSNSLKIIIIVQAFALQPILNPLIYGLKVKKIKIKMIQFLFHKKCDSEH